jgi:hypothetical protein
MVPEWVKLYLNYKILKKYLSISSQLKKMMVLAKKTKTQNEYRDIKKLITQTFVLMDKLPYVYKCFNFYIGFFGEKFNPQLET